MDNEPLHMTMLFDFFGDLLTGKQREYFDLYHNEDLSLSEIAEKAGITRQGVYDIITRAEKALNEMEHKTGVVRRWRDTREGLKQAQVLASNLLHVSEGCCEAADLAKELITKLEEIARV